MNFTFSKIVCALALLAMVFSSCGRSGYNSKLVQVDSLLNATQYEQADSLLKQCAPSNYSTRDRAYHALLRTQCDYKNYIVATTDSAINFAVDYFKKSDDKEKYTRSIIYQGCANEELGNLEKAVECYHKAERYTTNKKDLAYTKLRLGYLYQSQIVGADSIALQKFLESYDLYHNLNEKHYMLLSLGEIGILYRDRKLKNDSAIYYINEAISLADSLQDSYLEFVNYNSRAEYYCHIKKDYQKSKADALCAINKGGDEIDHPRAHFCLSLSYLKLGSLDSCLYFIQNAPRMVSSADSVAYYGLLSEIDRQNQDVDGALKNHDMAENIADSILIHSLNHRLLAVEKKYDTQQAELENAKLSLELRNTLLTLAAIVIGALALLLLVLRYRHRLREKENEYELLKADLNTSLVSLENMKSTVAQLESGHDNGNNTELKNILEEQIGAVHQLMKWSYELDSDTFVKKFNSLMTMPSGKEQESFWNNLHTITNELHDNVLTRAQEAAGGTLRDDEINYLALYCCGFSRSVIMTCMHYKSLGTVSNKKIQIAQKLNVPNLDEFPARPLCGQGTPCPYRRNDCQILNSSN